MNLDTKFIKKITDQTIAATIKATMNELNRQRMLKPTKDTAFIRTEKLLYNYNQFKEVVQSKLKQIETIEAEGLARRSKSITSFRNGTNIDTDSEIEKAETKIEEIQASIEKMNQYINFIGAALNKISDDPYFELIRLKYFEGLTHEEISCELEVDVSTITRNKNRLVNTLKIYLFTDDSIIELFD